MAKVKTDQVQIPSGRSEDQPATRKMLALVRDELKSDIRGLEQKMESGFQRLESNFHGLESRLQKLDSNFHGLESRLQKLDSNFHGLESRFSNLESGFHNLGSRFQNLESGFHKLDGRNSRMELLFEEQNANNRIVLEGLQTLWHRQERLEQEQR